jgi:hypothetical protein
MSCWRHDYISVRRLKGILLIYSLSCSTLRLTRMHSCLGTTIKVNSLPFGYYFFTPNCCLDGNTLMLLLLLTVVMEDVRLARVSTTAVGGLTRCITFLLILAPCSCFIPQTFSRF